jgi:hypothetical protein
LKYDFGMNWLSKTLVSTLLLAPVPCCAQPAAAAPSETEHLPQFIWKRSLPVIFGDPSVNAIGGTEVRALARFDNKLFAAIGYWKDSEEKNSALPGAQVLRLDDANSQWQVDFELSERSPWQPLLRRYYAFSVLDAVRFRTDDRGRQLDQPADLLLAGVWSRYPGLDAYSRASGSGPWTQISIPGQESATSHSQIRAFVLHRDRVTGIENVFAGASNAIFVGGYNRESLKIVWSPTPEWQGALYGTSHARVMSFAECNGKLYATIYNAIYERSDGPFPAWKKIFEASMRSQNINISGFRGLTCIPNPSGAGEVLLVSLEDQDARIYRIEPDEMDASGQSKATLELDISSFLTRALATETSFVIAAYNEMTIYPDPTGACPYILMGVEAKTPRYPQTFGKQNFYPYGLYLVRDCKGDYSVRKLRDLAINPEPQLHSVRAIVISPFASDLPGTLYAGGFDANDNPVHNTAWLYKGIPALNQ